MSDWLLRSTATDWLGLAGAVLLIVITWRYVNYTKAMMQASIAQAESSRKTAEIALHQWLQQQQQILLPVHIALDTARARLHAWLQMADQPHAVDIFVSNARNLEEPMHSADFAEAVSLSRLVSPALHGRLEQAVDAMRDMDRSIGKIKQNQKQAENFEAARRYGMKVLHYIREAKKVLPQVPDELHAG